MDGGQIGIQSICLQPQHLWKQCLHESVSSCFPVTRWEYIHVLQVHLSELYLVFLVASHKCWTEFLHQVVVGFERADHSDKPLQLSSNVQQFPHRHGTYVVQHTILFLPHHHLPERANEPLPAKKKPFISCWMNAKYHMWRWTGHWGLFRSLLCLFFTEELTLFPSAHHSLPTALFIYSVDALLSLFPVYIYIFFAYLCLHLCYSNACSKQLYNTFHQAIDKTGAQRWFLDMTLVSYIETTFFTCFIIENYHSLSFIQ